MSHPFDRLPSQQGQESQGCRPAAIDAVQGTDSENDGGTTVTAWGSAKDGQRRLGHSFWNSFRRGGGYTRFSVVSPVGSHKSKNAGESGGGPNEDHSAGRMDPVLASADPSRAQGLLGAKPAM